MKLSVIGTGYLGATHAAAMAELGHEVIGVDIDETKVELLSAGQVPFYEPALPELLARHVATGAVRFSTSIKDAAEFADLHFVCVGTPQKAGEYAADLAYVDAAFAALLEHVRPGAVLVGKSTVPVGTASRLAVLVRNAGAELAWNPEFLREGFAVEDTLRPDRIVIGTDSDAARARIEQAYASDHRHRDPRRQDRLRDRGAGEGRGELVPRHEDLVHQRDGRGVRGDRRGRHAARDRNRA